MRRRAPSHRCRGPPAHARTEATCAARTRQIRRRGASTGLGGARGAARAAGARAWGDAPASGPFLALVAWRSWRGARAARSVVRAWRAVRWWVESVVGVATGLTQPSSSPIGRRRVRLEVW
eukprot:scaffold31320_cov65-Phaeocystis_antarctica.AAC.2